jgi:putative tricarboxylic transport membrane protein
MDIVASLAQGFSVALTPTNIFYCFVGVLIGTLVGVLPGLGPSGGMALLIPATFGMNPVTATIMLAGIYYGSMFGGSTTSILVNIPGEAASVITCVDGYQMARKGRAGAALTMAAVGSWIAGSVSTVLLMFTTVTLAKMALAFGPAEYFSLLVLGFLILAPLGSVSLLRGVVMSVVGLLIGTVGVDYVSGATRFTFGVMDLYDGINFVPVAMGIFGVAEVLEMVGKPEELAKAIRVKLRDLLPTQEDWSRSWKPMLRGSFLGFVIGIIPGPAPVISSFLAYTLEKQLSAYPEEFGHGAIEGVAGPESANNASVGGAFVPLMALGVPFTPAMAVLLSGMMIQGIRPGPLMLSENPEMFWGFIASMYIGNLMLLVLNLPLVGVFTSLLRIPRRILLPLVALFCLIGAFGLRNSLIDLYVMITFGLIGYLLKMLRFDVTPLVLALILGDMMEKNFTQAMISYKGDLSVLVTRPISAVFLAASVLVVMVPLVRRVFPRMRSR